MKKISFCLIIIIVFSLFVYWLGLTQRRIEPGTFGVLQTKTNGLIEKPMLNGEKNWQWQFLLPTNTKLNLYEIEPHVSQQTVEGELPSGQFYSAIYTTDYHFDYSLTYTIAVTISPEAVVELIKMNQVTDTESLNTYLDCAAKTLAQLSTNYLLEKAKNNPDFRIEALRKDEVLRNVQIYKEFPLVEVYSLSIDKSKIPDYVLYEKLQNNHSLNQININTNKTEQDEKNDEKTGSN